MSKRLGYGERQRAGFQSEDDVAEQLRREGKNVSQAKRNNHGYDLEADGEKIEVKSAVETEYKGSDGYPIRGYVFSNMKKNPKATKYLLRCMSPDRSKVVKTYEIPAKEVKQQTLTITRNSMYEPFLKQSFLAHAPLPKARNEIHISDQSSPFRNGSSMNMHDLHISHGEKGYTYKEESLFGDTPFKTRAYKAVGGAIGISAGLGLTKTVNLANYLAGQRKTVDLNLSDAARAVVGASIGSSIGEMVSRSTK